LNYNVTRPKYSRPEWYRDDLSTLLSLLTEEKIRPIIAERIPLVAAVHAHELLEKGSVTGKLVLVNT
jgi:NADPH:quinone reductase-like Zn-dependent oxidoreductase